MLKPPRGFGVSFGSREQTNTTRESEEWGKEAKILGLEKKSSEFWSHRHLAVLLRRIMEFKCYSVVSDILVHRQHPKAWYQLNTDTPHHGFRDYKESRCAFFDTKCSGVYFNTLLSLHFLSLSSALVSLTDPFCEVAQKRKSWTPVSAYWGKWTFEVTEGDAGLSARENASKLSEGPLGRQC